MSDTQDKQGADQEKLLPIDLLSVLSLIHILLCRAGIETAITVDHPEIPLRLLPVALLLAVREGMDRTDALRAVTTVPARIAGMEQRIGMLRTGMDADCVLWSGEPLDFTSQVQAVFINGAPEYRRTV